MQPSFPEPLAFHLTWTTYGTWLPGDERGWIDKHGGGARPPDPAREAAARSRMTEPPLTLSPTQRRVVNDTVVAHCRIRRWTLHVVNARTNHIHVVITAPNASPKQVREQFKAWCTRRLKEFDHGDQPRRNWWTEGGSARIINDEEQLEAAIVYVRDGQ